MKRSLIYKLFKKYEQEKYNIRDMLLLSMKEVALETSDSKGKITMIIKYEGEE